MTMLERADLRDLRAYAPSAIGGVDLDLRDNVNPWGAPPSTRRMLASAADGISRYPSVGVLALTTAIAADAGVRAGEVVTGCGSDDVIDSLLRAVASPGDRVAHPEPSFGMIPAFARINGLEPVGVPLLPNGAADVDGLLATGARVIYVCSPNNPTGTVTPEPEIRRLVRCARGVVLVDEAYAEFGIADDLRREAPPAGNMLVTRTFSKAWGLAGLRVGYGVGNAELVAAVAKTRGPYKVNSLAAAAAAAAISQDGEWMRSRASETCAVRDELAASIRGRPGVTPWESHGNFIFAAIDINATEDTAASAAVRAAARFATLGIGVRAFESLPGIGDAVRIGLVRPEAVRRLIHAFDEVWPCA